MTAWDRGCRKRLQRSKTSARVEPPRSSRVNEIIVRNTRYERSRRVRAGNILLRILGIFHEEKSFWRILDPPPAQSRAPDAFVRIFGKTAAKSARIPDQIYFHDDFVLLLS